MNFVVFDSNNSQNRMVISNGMNKEILPKSIVSYISKNDIKIDNVATRNYGVDKSSNRLIIDKIDY